MTMRRQHPIWPIFQHQAAHQPINRIKYLRNFYIFYIQHFLNADLNRSGFLQSESDSDEEDPLDAYMMGIEKHLEKEKTKPVTESQSSTVAKTIKGTRGDIDDEDDEESYYR